MLETRVESRLRRLVAGMRAVTRRAGDLLFALAFVTDETDGEYLTLVSPDGLGETAAWRRRESLGVTPRSEETPRSWQ